VVTSAASYRRFRSPPAGTDRAMSIFEVEEKAKDVADLERGT
jgi:hypothetical protein